MNFLEKDLETIIWENYDACHQRGLRINHAPFERGKRFRQMNLMPYGVADLVNIYYDPIFRECWVQVIECKRAKVTGATYVQAKRYVAAVEAMIHSAELVDLATIKIHSSVVLIGSSLDTATDLIHAIAKDTTCSTYTYFYGVDGISFEDKSNYWWLDSTPGMCSNEFMTDTHGLGKYILDRDYHYYSYKKDKGDPVQPLLITKDGVLLNPKFSQL